MDDEICPRCRGTLDRATAGYAEQGLVCRPCHREREAALAGQAGTIRVDSFETELVNAVGVAARLATGIGFHVTEGYAGERLSPTEQPEFFVYLRRSERVVGPFHVRALERMWREGGVRRTDLYRYPGMTEWRLVAEFVPPRPPK